MPSGTRPLPGPLSIEVAQTLLAVIRDRGASQADIAGAADMSASQLSRTLSGQKVFTLDQLDAVCAALGEDIVRIVGEADAATRDRRPTDNVTPFPTRNVVPPSEDEMYEAARPTDPEPTDEQPSYDEPS